MEDFSMEFNAEGILPEPDTTAAEGCPFTPLPDPAKNHPRREITEEGAQRLFDGEDPSEVTFDMQKRLREEYALMRDLNWLKWKYTEGRTLRRSYFAARGHIADSELLRYVSDCIAENKPFTDDNWPDDPDYYLSSTVRRYSGTLDRFMRTIVGMNDMADMQAQSRLKQPFKDEFDTAYRRYFTSHQAYHAAHPKKDARQMSPDPEINWRLGRRGNGDNTAAVQIMHTLSYYMQHRAGSIDVDDLWSSALTSATVFATTARIRSDTFESLGLKDIVPDYDDWENGETFDRFLPQQPIFVYDKNGLAKPLSDSLSEENDNYCSANIPVKHTDPEERQRLETVVEWVREHSNWPGVDDGEGGLLHEDGTFEQVTFQLMLGACIGQRTISPSFLDHMRMIEGYPYNEAPRSIIPKLPR